MKRRLAAMLASLVLLGCAPAARHEPEFVDATAGDVVEAVKLSRVLYRVTMRNGDRCYIYSTSGYYGGISCRFADE